MRLIQKRLLIRRWDLRAMESGSQIPLILTAGMQRCNSGYANQRLLWSSRFLFQGGRPVGQFLFPILNNIQNQGVQFNTETRLNSQDTFVPTEVGIFLCNPSSAVDATFKPITWASPFTFANAAAMQDPDL